jgi:tetratricopeptide (TPR) repeat protein
MKRPRLFGRRSACFFNLIWFGLSFFFFAGCQMKELSLAKVYIQQNHWDKAVAALEQAVAEHPENAEAQFLLGRGYATQRRFAEMNRAFAASLAAAARFEPEIKTWRQKYFSEYFNAGVQAAGENKFSAARDFFAAAASIEAKQPDVVRNLARVHAQLGELEKALQLYQVALATDPADWETYLAVAALHNDQRDYDQSAAVLEQALRRNPRQSQILAALANVYDCLGKSEDALAAYQQALQIKPDDKELLQNLARLYLARTDYAHALQQYAKVLSLEPDHFEANYNIGLIYLKMGERSQKLARELEKQNAAALRNKSKQTAPADSAKTIQLNFEAARNFKTAVPFLLKAAQLDTLHAGAYFNLGAGFSRLGETEKAKAAFTRYEQLQEKNNQTEKPD